MDSIDPKEDGFRPVDFSVDIDFKAHIQALPEDATLKGMFFTDLLDAVRRVDRAKLEELPYANRRYLPFSDYPQQDYFPLFEQTVRILHPGIPNAEGVRRVALSVYPRFAESFFGKIVVGIFVDDIDRLIAAAAKAYQYCARPGRVDAIRIGDGDWRYQIRDFPGAILHFWSGLTEGMFAHYGLATPTIMVKKIEDWSFDLSVQWNPE